MPVAWVVVDFGHAIPSDSRLPEPGLDAVDSETRDPAAYAEGIRILRHLGTPAAARAMAERLPIASRDFRSGLLSSRDPNAALGEMEDLLEAPDFSVTDSFIFTMAHVRVDSLGGNPFDQWDGGVPYWERLGDVIGEKTGRARTESAAALAVRHHGGGIDLDPETLDLLREIVAGDFDAAPVRDRLTLVLEAWADMDPDFLAPLAGRLALEPGGGAALPLWYELDPAAARAAVLEAIASPAPVHGAEVLGLLPDTSLPELDAAMARNVLGTSDPETLMRIATLIERYATGAIDTEVRAILERPVFPCARESRIRVPLVAYLVRVDPAGVPGRLDDGSGCVLDLVSVAMLEDGPVLEQAALETLARDDTLMTATETAARYLAEYGSAAAQDALWTRLSAWSAKWAGRENEFNGPGVTQNLLLVFALGSGNSLIDALATGRSWLLDEAGLERLLGLARAAQQEREIGQWLGRWRDDPWGIAYSATLPGGPEIRFLQYRFDSVEAAKAKLGQLPVGSSFQWTTTPRNAEDEAAFGEIESFAASVGLRIERAP